MRVSLLYWTGKGLGPWAAADLMIFTKNTRIKMAPDGLISIAGWSEVRKMQELTYMANTIRSSWEFCDYVFLLEDVTRAFTHQLVRTRHASYAQQTMQILKIDSNNVETPRDLNDDSRLIWHVAMSDMSAAYEGMLTAGATVEQARGVLPTNIRTNIVVKMNLRTLAEVFGQRISPRNLGEYSEVARAMRAAVLEVHPWAEVFLHQTRDRYLEELDAELKFIRDSCATRQMDALSTAATRAMKFVDQIRRDRPTQEGEE